MSRDHIIAHNSNKNYLLPLHLFIHSFIYLSIYLVTYVFVSLFIYLLIYAHQVATSNDSNSKPFSH